MAKRMWHEAVDYKKPGWPPGWLRYVAAWIVIIAAVATIVRLATAFIASLGLGLGDFVAGSELSQIVLGGVERYFNRVGPELGIVGDLLFKSWAVCGVFLFCTAASGLFGARIGWTCFGFLTGAIVYAEASASTRLLAASIVAALWAVVAVPAFYGPFKWKGRKRVWDRLFSIADAPAGTSSRQTAEDAALALGYADLWKYFDDKGNLKLEIIGKELGVNRRVATALRLENVPAGFRIGQKFSPGEKRSILAQCGAVGADVSAVAVENGVSVRTLRTWMRADPQDGKPASDRNEQ